MKKIKLFGKLNLKKETIVKLNNDQMNAIVGGVDTTSYTDTTRTTDTSREKAKADSIAARS
ncbi:MAG TPA: class I lanthipeptide [Bacteroidia bacterium]|nr:class I lanthipeptide [Bacteroidia bacterium]